jgi:hypothetical protein
VRDGAVDLGEAMGSSGMQCEVVAVRRIWWGRVDIMMNVVVGRIARRSMYDDFKRCNSIIVIALS